MDIGLIDTMSDLLVNFIGAVVFSFIGFFFVKSQGKGKLASQFIPQLRRSRTGKAGGIVMEALCQKQFLQLAPPQRQIRGRRSSGFWMPCLRPWAVCEWPCL